MRVREEVGHTPKLLPFCSPEVRATPQYSTLSADQSIETKNASNDSGAGRTIWHLLGVRRGPRRGQGFQERGDEVLVRVNASRHGCLCGEDILPKPAHALYVCGDVLTFLELRRAGLVQSETFLQL